MIAIIKYNAGNTYSVQNAVNNLGYQSIVTDDASLIKSATKVIFPGVGEASSAMKYLRQKGLDEVILSLTQPVLGICLGMQLLCTYSEEGNTTGIGVFDSLIKLFPSKQIVPHMGWNNFSEIKGSIMHNINPHQDVYYVHSYYAEICSDTIATCDYILPFSAALHKNNFYATQFHPEKSADVGALILQNFLAL